ncbi:MAG: hypothetical protein AAGI09_02815 [Pseudomonadota bacterium]
MKKPRIHITDHALVRYAEEVAGLDLDPVREHIAQEVARGVDMRAIGVRKTGYVYKLEGTKVVTITPSSKPNKRKGSRSGSAPAEDEDA